MRMTPHNSASQTNTRTCLREQGRARQSDSLVGGAVGGHWGHGEALERVRGAHVCRWGVVAGLVLGRWAVVTDVGLRVIDGAGGLSRGRQQVRSGSVSHRLCNHSHSHTPLIHTSAIRPKTCYIIVWRHGWDRNATVYGMEKEIIRKLCVHWGFRNNALSMQLL